MNFKERVNRDIKDITEFDPYDDYYEVKDKEDLLNYQKHLENSVNDGLCFAGISCLTPNYEGYTEGDVYCPLTYYEIVDEILKKIVFGQEYMLEIATGKVKNASRGSYMTLNENGQYGLRANGKPKFIQAHILQPVSLYPKFNWKNFFLNLKIGGKATVDHVMGKHELCHPNLLEPVPNSENSKRGAFLKTDDERKKSGEKTGETQSKPCVAYKNGDAICDENKDPRVFDNALKCAEYLFGNSLKGSEEDKKKQLDNLRQNITKRLNGKVKSPLQGYTFDFSDEFKKSQTDLINNIYELQDDGTHKIIEENVTEPWFSYDKLEDWRKDLIEEKIGDKNPPKEMSKMGRALGSDNIKTFGAWNKNLQGRMCLSTGGSMYTMLFYWFGDIEEVKKMHADPAKHILRHSDGEIPHPLVKRQSENGEENSNIWGTFKLGTGGDNANDRSQKKIREAKDNTKNEFKVIDNKGIEIDRTFHSAPEFKAWAKGQKIYEKIDFGSHITEVLNGKGKSCKGFKFSYVDART